MVEAVVEFDYQATEDDELTLVKGEIITNVVKMDGGWWEGTLRGKTGMFPDNFVKETKKEKNKELSSSIKRGSAAQAGGGHVAELANKLGKEGLKVGAGPTKRQDSKPAGAGGATENQQAAAAAAGATTASIPNRVRVAHSYTPKNDDELELIVGQIINVTNKEEEGWWEGSNPDGRSGVFPSNFVEECKDEEDNGDGGEFHAIQGKKVKGIGFGNIFAGGPVKLKGAKKQDSGDTSTEHAKPAPQEAKRKSHAPPVPSEPQNAAPKEKPAFMATKSKSCSALEGKPYTESLPKPPPPQQQFYYMTGSSVMDYCSVSSDERERRGLSSPEDVIGDYPRDGTKPKKYCCPAKDDDLTCDKPKGVCIVVDDSDDDDDDEYDDDDDGPVWLKMSSSDMLQCTVFGDQTAYESGVQGMEDDDMEHTSVDCRITSEEESEDGDDDMYEVYVPYTHDVSNTGSNNEGAVPQSPARDSAADDSNLTCISELDQGSFVSNGGNVSSASDVTVPFDLGSLSHARETPPPKLTFRKRRSIGTPKNSPIPTVRSSVTPPQVDRPPVKKQRVSPTFTHLADREGPLGLVPLDTSSTGQYTGPVPRRPIEVVPEESFVEESIASEASTNTSPNHYYSAVESCASGDFYTPTGMVTPSTNDETMTANPDDLLSPIYVNLNSKKRVSFSPQDLYIAPSGKRIHLPNIWAHSPLKYLRKSKSSTPTSRENCKPLEAEHITDSVKLARQRRRLSSGPHQVKHQAVQVTILPAVVVHHDAATETDPVYTEKPISPLKKLQRLHSVDSDENMLPQYVPYSVKDRFRIINQWDSAKDTEVHGKQDHQKEQSVEQVEHDAKIKRRSSFAAVLASAFVPKKKPSRKSELYVASTTANVHKGKRRSLPASLHKQDVAATTLNTRATEEELNSNPLNLRDDQSNDAFVLDPVLVPMEESTNLMFPEKSATLPRTGSTSETYYMPVKFGPSDDVSYFEFMQRRGRISPAIQNIVKKYRISTGGQVDSIREEDSTLSDGESGDVSKAEEVKRHGTGPVEAGADVTQHASLDDKVEQSDQQQTAQLETSTDELKLTEARTYPRTEQSEIDHGMSRRQDQSITCASETEAQKSDVDKEELPAGHLREIYNDLHNIRDIIKTSFSEIPESDLKIENISNVNMSALERSADRANLSKPSAVSPSAFFDSDKRPSSTTPSGPRRRRKFNTPPSVGKAQRVLITVEENKREEEGLVTPAVEFDGTRAKDTVDVAPQRRSAAKKRMSHKRAVLKEQDADLVPQEKIASKKKAHNPFHKFKKRKVGTLKESTWNETEKKPTTKEQVVDQKPRKVSLFRRFSQKIRGKKDATGGDNDSVQVTFADVAELCLPDNSDGSFSAKRELFGCVETPASSVASREEGEVSEQASTQSSDIPEKTLDKPATEADSMKVLIDEDDQLAMEGELTGNEEDWQVLNNMLKSSFSSGKKSPSSKAESVNSIKDEYIDDELNDTMELTGDLYPSQVTQPEDVATPTKVHVELTQDPPNYTSTPSKKRANPQMNMSLSLEVLFNGGGSTEPAEDPHQFCSGDFVVRSPGMSSYNSGDVTDLVTDTPEKRMYYNLTNQELSPSIGGFGDADHCGGAKESTTVVLASQQQVE